MSEKLPLVGDSRLPDRFWSKVELVPFTTCWLWTGNVNEKGYARFAGRPAARLAYEVVFGPVPKELVMDHFRCEQPACVNLAHVRPVTVRENTLRGCGPTSRFAGQLCCQHGHEYTTSNTYFYRGSGSRKCRACNRDLERSRRARRKAGINVQR